MSTSSRPTQSHLLDPTPNTHPFSIDGKPAIVTGAGSGINLCFASLLLSRSCNVLFTDLALRPEAQTVIDTYSSKIEGKSRAIFQKTDVTDWKQLSRMFEVAEKEFGGTDIVCPGACIYDPYWTNFWHPPGSAASKDVIDAGHYASIDISITHPIRTTQLAIASFLKPSHGQKVTLTNPKRVAITSSVAGQCAHFCTPLYVASKHASQVGIRVNGVAPGLDKTPLWTDHPENMKFVDTKKDVWVMPEEVAEAMLRLLEDPEMGGGTILEVGAKQTRKVAMFNDPGPSGAGHTVSNMSNQFEEVLEWLGEDGWGYVKL
ncbi:NAD(P)-binding protein [Lepidopterella palustris CBS 459.81]|uniref:NAD(P)-binding protein n=1 Tax=Lepidopterella palustris CBS 459.81 TaxID=1314670 RepID=A0A8E2E8M0_9PEZI|nr:NAD(P)-binding protein [Lepidopterella palustris CBS 459.81]